MIQFYHDVVVWLLKRDLLVTLHLRVRIVATIELKEKVRVKRELARARRERIRRRSGSVNGRKGLLDVVAAGAGSGSGSGVGGGNNGATGVKPRRDSESKASDGGAPDSSPVEYWMSMSPKSARRQARRISMSPSARSGTTRRERSLSLLYGLAEKDKRQGGREGFEEEEEEEEEEDVFLDEEMDVASLDTDEARAQAWDEARPSLISDPARATPLERQWLAAMSEGKDASIARRFQQ